MKIGDKVKINPDNVPSYFDYEANPVHLTGKVSAIYDHDEFGDFNIDVEFSDGTLNAYNEEHLVLLK